jgi:hypothetical protein
MNNYGDAHYAIWSERSVIADCLRKLGLDKLANGVHTPDIKEDIIANYVNLIKMIAEATKDNDVLDRLYFAGLIYG